MKTRGSDFLPFLWGQILRGQSLLLKLLFQLQHTIIDTIWFGEYALRDELAIVDALALRAATKTASIEALIGANPKNEIPITILVEPAGRILQAFHAIGAAVLDLTEADSAIAILDAFGTKGAAVRSKTTKIPAAISIGAAFSGLTFAVIAAW